MALPILDGNQTAATLSTIITGGAHIPAHTVVSLGSQAISDITSAFPASQTISGTVTANLTKLASHASTITKADNQIQIIGGYSGGSPFNATAYPMGVDSSGNISAIVNWVGTGGSSIQVTTSSSLPVQVVSQGSVTIGAMPNGALTTRFGSVATANTAQITSAVTNTSRKYLLAQNISAGTVTIGIGFSPTTTQGIQLTAGGGLTFDAFCPTGAVYWLGAVTGAAFTILEG